LAYDVLLALADGLGVEPAALVGRAGDLDPQAACSAFGRRLRALRTATGVSQEKLAESSHLHPTAVGSLERCLSDPRYTTVLRLAHGLGVKPRALMEDPERDTGKEA
jgi:ribosome-binding protein aMBF1 (putative translation factor)